jgi:hypothetical protein
MRKLGVVLAVATLLLSNVGFVRSAKADGGTTATIAAAVIAGLVTVLTLKCTDATKEEYLCIQGPPPGHEGAGPAVPSGSTLLPKAAQNLFNDKTVQFAATLHPEMKFPKNLKLMRLAKKNKTVPSSTLIQTAAVH